LRFEFEPEDKCRQIFTRQDTELKRESRRELWVDKNEILRKATVVSGGAEPKSMADIGQGNEATLECIGENEDDKNLREEKAVSILEEKFPDSECEKSGLTRDQFRVGGNGVSPRKRRNS
jgi:hypothetical protein